MIILYITCKDMQQATSIANHLLQKKLIACANTFPITSMYNWENKIQTDNEIVLLIKTTQQHEQEIKKQVEQIHDYDVPCILTLDAQANTPFDQWVQKEVKHDGKPT